jgi:hypothetical protein
MNAAIPPGAGPLGPGHPPVSRALAGGPAVATGGLLAIYDELLADVRGQLERDGGDIANRAALLRTQLDRRVIGELGLEVHSFALPSLVAYLGQAVRLYLLGFYDAAIVEATARLAAALRGRLLSLVVWERLGQRTAPLVEALRRYGGDGDPARLAASWRERRVDGLAVLPFDALIDLAESLGVLDSPARPRILASLRDLAAKRQAIDERDTDQGRQITLGAVDSGRLSGGPGAAHTEPLLGYYLTWGSSLHLLLTDAVAAVCLVLEAGERRETAD